MGPVKAMLLETDVSAARKVLLPLLEDRTGTADPRAMLTKFARDCGLPL
jgi:phosphotransferase system enzyme I (PtsP)